MERYIVASIGAIIAAAAVIYLVKLLVMWFTGIKTTGEVIAVREPKQGTFVHTLRYCADGKNIVSDDKTGYSQAFSVSDRLEIVYRRRLPERFEYTSALKKNIIVSAVLVVMSVLIVIRFMF
ncbi:MAG: hypothetical protein K2J37_04280, partial [Ruminococcus sp.]|nr:hypothetical protein [Ruminococcus sp.]